MKKLFLTCLALVMIALPAHAGWNIKQKADGTAVWIDGKSVEVPIGDSGLVVRLTDVTTASTAFVVTHKKGKIKKVYAVNSSSAGSYDSNSNAPVLTIGIANGLTTTFTPISSGATVTLVTTGDGLSASVVPLDVNVDVEQGYVISVASDGGGGGTGNDVTVTIVVE